MAKLQSALQQLREERKQAEEQVEILAQAISAIEGILGRSSRVVRNSAGIGRVVSAAARRKMAQAQRARWARVRAAGGGRARAGKPRVKRELSAAARRKIAAAQKARWARFRAQREKAAA